MRLMIGIFLLLGTSGIALSQEKTPVITPFPTSITDPFPFLNGLFCLEAKAGLGSTWQGITIGESTLDQLKSKMMELSENYIFSDHRDGGVTFSLPTQRE